MSSIECPYCSRDTFRTERALQQHLNNSRVCSEKHEAAVSLKPSKRQKKATHLAHKLMQEPDRVTRSRVDRAFAAHDATSSKVMVSENVGQQPDNLDGGRVVGQTPRKEVGEAGLFGQHAAPDNDAFCQVDETDFLPLQDDGWSSEEDGDAEEEVGDDDEEDSNTGLPNTVMGSEFLDHCNERFRLPLTRAERTCIKLMDVLHKKKAPMNAHRAVMDWHLRENKILKDHEDVGNAGEKHYVSRSTMLARLTKRYKMEGKGPFERVVRLPSSKEVVKIPCHRAIDCIEQLLTNPLLQKEDYQFFNDDPLAPPPVDLDYVGDCNTGQAYTDTYHHLVDEPHQLPVGVIFYIDGASTGQFNHLPVTAVKMSLSIFTQKARTKEHMWATLGWIPRVRKSVGRGKKIFHESGHMEAGNVVLKDDEGSRLAGEDEEQEDGYFDVKAQDFHRMLSVILEGYVDLERTGCIFDLVYDRRVYRKTLLTFFTLFCRVDTEEADTLAGRYKPRTANIKQVCRYCHVPTLEADDYRHKPVFKTQPKIEKLIKTGKIDKLKAISQHCIKNAMYDLTWHKANSRGIHGGCPSEKLHTVLLGIFPYTRRVFFTSVGENSEVAEDINGLARRLGKQISRQSDRTLPNTNLSGGVKDVANYMGKDYRGVLLLLAAVLRTTEGRTMLETKRKFRKNYQKDDWLLLVELLLEWEAYLCQPTMKKKHVVRLEKKHRYLMYVMRQVAERKAGMQWKVFKFHSILHLAQDIQLFGVPMEFDTGANESHHKPTKYGAQLTQRNEETFDIQVAERMHEFRIIGMARQEIEQGYHRFDYYDDVSDQSSASETDLSRSSDQDASMSDQSQLGDTKKKPKTLTDDARIRVYRDEKDGHMTFELLSRSKTARQTLLDTNLLEFLIELQDKVIDYIPEHSLPIFTRHKRNNDIFHGHPNYRGTGEWRDWVVVDWGAYGQLPCHIACFVVITGLKGQGNRPIEHGDIRLKDGVYAVVESAELDEDEDEIKMSDLFIPYLKDVGEMTEDGGVISRKYYLADTEAFVKPCAGIPDIGGKSNRFFIIKPRTEWHNEFIKWVERPHDEDEMDEE